MSDASIIIGDERVKNQLNENANKLDISLDELIEKYIRRGLYKDDYYKQPKLSKDELDKIFKIDRQNGKRSSKDDPLDALVGIYDHSKE